jgi:hypothetical protein
MPRPALEFSKSLEEFADTISVEDLVAKLRSVDRGDVAVLGVWSESPFDGGQIIDAHHSGVEVLVNSPDTACQDVLRAMNIYSLYKRTLVVYSMYSQGRTVNVVRLLADAAKGMNLDVDVCLLEGGLHKFVNTVCRGFSNVVDVPGLLQQTRSEAWAQTPNHGFVSAMEQHQRESLSTPEGRARPTLSFEEDEPVNSIGAADLIGMLQNKDMRGRVSILGVWSDREFSGGQIANAQHKRVGALLHDDGHTALCMDVIDTIMQHGILDTRMRTLVVYSMYSHGRTFHAAQALATCAAQIGAKLEIVLLEGGSQKFVNTVCSGLGKVVDVPGLLEKTRAASWQSTPKHGFVCAEEVTGLEVLREYSIAQSTSTKVFKALHLCDMAGSGFIQCNILEAIFQQLGVGSSDFGLAMKGFAESHPAAVDRKQSDCSGNNVKYVEFVAWILHGHHS